MHLERKGTSSSADQPFTTGSKSSVHPNRVLLAIMGVALMVNYVETMVIPVIPMLQTNFSSSPTVASWILSAFLITGCVASPLFGKLGDNYGKKKMLLISIIFYISGVAMAGFSTSMGFLIFARAFQGLGFGAVPLSFAIIADVFPRERIAAAQGIMSGAFAMGGVLGLVIGSYIAQYFGWQWAFHSALIASVILLVAVALLIEPDLTKLKVKVDYVGALLLTAGVSISLLYITEGPSLGWMSNLDLLMLISGLSLTFLFFVVERKIPDPLIKLHLLKERNVFVSNTIGMFTGILMQVMFLSVVYYARDPPPFGFGLNNISTALILAPGAISMAIIGPFIGRMTGRIGPKPLILAGSSLLGLGLALFTLERSTEAWLAAGGVAIWIGMISVIIPLINMVAVSLPSESRAVGLGMNVMLRSLGAAIGPAIASSVMTSYSVELLVNGTGANVPTKLLFPTSMAFNVLMGFGFVLVSIIIGLNMVTRNYTSKDPAVKNRPVKDETPLRGESG
ncbi:MAG: MFS transporter [Candidatus Thermoplasmatota archaeon]|nr:MFS transporter [Candidatus Thermoplasmatota archaeon]MDA8143005.1 MFS transporter [Thermoplasmatales archaeon]